MGRRAWAFCAVLATCLSLGTPTAGAVSSPSPTGGGGRQPAAERTLSAADLEAQIAAADRLRQDLEGTSAQIAGATTRLERLAVQANTLLQQYAHARDTERAARAEANRNVRLFEEMNAQATEDRKALGQWAFQAYTGGGSIVELTALLDSLNTPAAEAIDPVAHVAYLSDQRVHALERIQHLAANQRDVALRAVEARTRATDAALAAAQAKRQLDAVIARQRQELEATRALHEQQVARWDPSPDCSSARRTSEPCRPPGSCARHSSSRSSSATRRDRRAPETTVTTPTAPCRRALSARWWGRPARASDRARQPPSTRSARPSSGTRAPRSA